MEVQSWSQTNFQSSRTSSSSSSPSFSSSSATSTEVQMNLLSNSSSSPETSFSLKISSSSHIHRDQEYTPPSPQISYLAVQDNSLYAASLNQISVFDLTSYTLTDTFGCKNPSSGLVKSISFIDNENIFTAHQDCKIRVWRVVIITDQPQPSSSTRKHRLVSTLPTLKDRLWRSISAKNYVQVRRHKQTLWIQHADAVSGLAAVRDRLLMYSISWDRSFKMWKLMSESSSDRYPCCMESVNDAHSDAINAIAVISPNNGKGNHNIITLYTASADGTIKVWEKPAEGDRKMKHRLLTTLDEHNSRSVNALVLNNDESILFSGGSDTNIVAWEIINNNNNNHDDDDDDNDQRTAAAREASKVWRHRTLSGHRGAVLCLIYEGDFLISGSSDTTVRIWRKNDEDKDCCGYCCVAVLEGHSKPVKSLAALISGRNLNKNKKMMMMTLSIFSGSLDGEIKVWQIDVTNFNNSKKEGEKQFHLN